MFLRLEILGHYLEMGRADQADPEEGPPADTQYPMVADPGIVEDTVGFRLPEMRINR